MANVGDVRVKMSLDTRDFKKELADQSQQFKQGVENQKKQINELSTVIREQKQAYDKLGLGATGALVAIGLGLSKATSQFAGLNQAMADLKSVTNASTAELEKAKQAAEQFGPAFGKSAGQAADVLTEFQKAGYELGRLTGGELKDALSLIVSGSLEAGDAATYAANSLSIYKKENLSLKQIADIAVGAANSSSTSVKEMADANRQLGAVAATVGHSFEDVNTEFALMAQNGLRGLIWTLYGAIHIENSVNSVKPLTFA